jgi:hypothetical protein
MQLRLPELLTVENITFWKGGKMGQKQAIVAGN